MKGVNIFLADGFEDIEALAVNDILRRGGIRTNLVSISEDPFVTSSHGVTLGVECFLADLDLGAAGTGRKDIMIFPGGMPGSKHLGACKPLVAAMKEHYAAGGSLAAICAAPGTVLSQLDCWEGKIFTCYDGCEGPVVAKGGLFVPKPCICDERIITGRGPAYAIDFGLEILSYLTDEATAAKVRQGMFLDGKE